MSGLDLPAAGERRPRRSASHGEAGYPRAAFDFYPTEPWVTRALCRAVEFNLPGVPRPQWIWEPACGDGRMAEVLAEFGYAVLASDLADHGYGRTGVDFLRERPPELPLAAIVTNPPFALAAPFIARAIELTRERGGKVAMLQRHEFDAPRRNRPLFEPPFATKLILPRRPRWSDEDTASPRFPYAWYLWDWAQRGPPVIRWLDDDAGADAQFGLPLASTGGAG